MPVNNGDELLMEAAAKRNPGPDKVPKKETWRTHEDKSLKKHKKNYDSSGRMKL